MTGVGKELSQTQSGQLKTVMSVIINSSPSVTNVLRDINRVISPVLSVVDWRLSKTGVWQQISRYCPMTKYPVIINLVTKFSCEQIFVTTYYVTK